MKKTLFFLLIIPIISFAQVDYSKLNNKKYTYSQNNMYPQVENQIYVQPKNNNKASSQNPKDLSHKYKNLYNNRATYNNCWNKAAISYGLDPWLLLAYAKVESSFQSHAINKNNDNKKSIDVGLMQINTFWFPHLQKFGISKQDLLDPCLSLFVASWIIRQNIQRFGYNIDGIGAYNSPNNQKIRRNYALKVYKAYDEITKDLYYSQLR